MTEDQLREYRHKGYVVIRGLFSKDECNRLKAELQEEISHGRELANTRKDLEPASGEYDRQILADVPRGIDKGMLQDIAHRSAVFMSVAKDERILNCIRPIIGKDVAMYRSLCVFKPSDYRGEIGWHYDMSYWRGGDLKVTAWLSLDRADQLNGALHFIPGSNASRVYDLEHQNEIFFKVVPERYVDAAKDEVVETDIGDMVLMDTWVFHRSGRNQSGQDRHCVIFTYQPANDTSHHRQGLPELICGIR